MSKKQEGIGDRWIEVCKLLNSYNADYIVIGGVAVGLHGYVRATKDIDILVPRNVENTRRVLEALSKLPWGIAKEMDPREVDQNPITIVGDDPRVDILKAAQSVNYKVAEGSKVTTSVAGTIVPYASINDLIQSKIGTDRPKDEQDILELKQALARDERNRSNTPGNPASHTPSPRTDVRPSKEQTKSQDPAIQRPSAMTTPKATDLLTPLTPTNGENRKRK